MIHEKAVAVLIVLALVVVGWGFYRGWFALSSSEADKGNKVNVNLTVDGDKVQEDVEAVKEKTAELTESVTGGEKNPDRPASDNVKANNP